MLSNEIVDEYWPRSYSRQSVQLLENYGTPSLFLAFSLVLVPITTKWTPHWPIPIFGIKVHPWLLMNFKSTFHWWRETSDLLPVRLLVFLFPQMNSIWLTLHSSVSTKVLWILVERIFPFSTSSRRLQRLQCSSAHGLLESVSSLLCTLPSRCRILKSYSCNRSIQRATCPFGFLQDSNYLSAAWSVLSKNFGP